MNESTDARRTAALTSLSDAGRELSTAMVLFHANLAKSVGLGATDEKVLELVQRFGSPTASDLVEHTGLAKNSVTDVIDRLARQGFIARAPDPVDRRRVRVTATDEGLRRMTEPFRGLMSRLSDLAADYTDEQLELLADYVRRAAAIQEQEARRLGGDTRERSRA